ncbi:3,4-dihydroxy-2-butanone-4-phosphate synthase [Candidatus Hecatella orcuttiae]|jgi:3,4-dihydroxy 2-butanone 4-phosphate synthase|uniref:3,4-dihydroxy-2-butanone-4-phosphate synthase n=1 Tax=Candidatus Hecatella orcuttiae TaxID=1935119 RepID=UPI002867BE8F|nr:3,4-dihydroxy-2-butanone-4-phosphate synthase [Candidatus Hecatella orcuttiae]
MSSLTDALHILKNGGGVQIFDCNNREGETDLVYAAEYITSEKIFELRSQAGGLICLAFPFNAARLLGLPFMVDILKEAAVRFPGLHRIVSTKTLYGDRPAFSITINHRKTYTGITDADRVLTIVEFAKLVREALDKNASRSMLRKRLWENFVSPGHLHLLIAEENFFTERRGHTELSLALAEMAGITPAMVICEMLDGQSGKALDREKAWKRAREYGMPFLDGEEILNAYKDFKGG